MDGEPLSIQYLHGGVTERLHKLTSYRASVLPPHLNTLVLAES